MLVSVLCVELEILSSCVLCLCLRVLSLLAEQSLSIILILMDHGEKRQYFYHHLILLQNSAIDPCQAFMPPLIIGHMIDLKFC